MPGITAYGAYVPRYRLGPATSGWNSPGERAVANFDEDSVTMAVAAGADCLRVIDRNSVDALVFASTTPPYAEKQCAAIVATALDLRPDIFTADVTNVLRAGTAALKTALDSVIAGSSARVLVVASDHRQGPPRGETERNSGDGAVAFLVDSAGVPRGVGVFLFPHRKYARYLAFVRRPLRPAPGKTGSPPRKAWSGSLGRRWPGSTSVIR